MVEPRDVLLLWPNVICYVRAALGALALGLAFKGPMPMTVTALYVSAMTLDFLDGYVARRWQQQSSFGASLDVVVDVAQRGGMWILALNLPGFLFPLLELLCFACTHGGGSWKVDCFADAPWLVSLIMSNGFKSPLGSLTVAGLHFLSVGFLILGLALVFGRCLGLLAELWVIQRHVAELLRADAVALSERHKASYICVECEDALCSRCSAQIHRVGARQNHTLFGLRKAAYSKRLFADNLDRLMGILQRNIERSYDLSPWFVFYDQALAPSWYNFTSYQMVRADPNNLVNPPIEEVEGIPKKADDQVLRGLPGATLLKDTHVAQLTAQGACFDVPPPVHVKFATTAR